MTALSQLGWVALGQGDLNRAADLYEMAWESAADAGGPVAAVIAYFLAVTRLELGNVRHAEQLLAQATDLIHAAGFRTAEGRLLTLRANFAERAGDQQATDGLLADAVALERTIDSQPGLIEVLTILGIVMVERGQRARAVEPLREAFGLAVSHGAHVRLARVLEAMSGALIDAHPSASVRLAVAAQELRDTLQAHPLPTERARLGRYLEEARQRLGEAVYAEISSATRLQPTDVVIDECFMLLDQVLVPAPPTPSPGASAATADLLTEREREVVVLLTHGLNNREIAEELVVTRKTVESHISHILTKLDLTSRLQVATWAYEHGPAQPSVTMLAVN
jgi:ATP/maltotriose-dependent transcriptional regulator MalT